MGRQGWSSKRHLSLKRTCRFDGTGIRVQALAPGLTVTEFHSRLGADFTMTQGKWMRPEQVVDISLKVLEKGQVLCIPGVKTRLIARCAGVLPRRVYYRLMQVIGEKMKKRWDEIEKTSNAKGRI